MTEYEKQLVEELDQDYRELVDGMSDLLALDTANLILHYGTDGKKVLDDIIRLIAVASQALRVPMGKVMAKTGMLEESVAEFEPGSDVLYINADYVNGREDLESAGKLLKPLHHISGLFRKLLFLQILIKLLLQRTPEPLDLLHRLLQKSRLHVTIVQQTFS